MRNYSQVIKSQKHQNDPQAEIAMGNPWYTDDQFCAQLGTLGRRTVIENRWRIFENALSERVKNRTIGNCKQPIRILDAGCGDGINLFGLSQIIARLRLGAKIFGIDYNPLRIRRACKSIGVSGVYQASLYALPFHDGDFDIILCNHVLEHIADDCLVLGELSRVLNKDGILILGVPNEGCLIAKIRNHIVQPGIARTTDHVNFYTEKILRRRLLSAGFRFLCIEREGFFTPHLRLNSVMVERSVGRAILSMLQRLIPSQCAGLIALCIVDRKQ